VLGAIAGWGQVAMCAEYLSSRMFSWQRGHWSTFISVRMFLPFQFLPLSFYTSTCFPAVYKKSVLIGAGFLHSARALHRQYDIRTLSLTTRVPSLQLARWGRLLIIFGMRFLPEGSRTFYEVRACNCSEEFPMRKVQRTCREETSVNAFEASV
jgi:hypothetical protein